MDTHYFTIDEAKQQIPALRAAFARVMQFRGMLKTLYKRLDAKGFAPKDDDFEAHVPGASPGVVADRGSFKGLVEALKEELAAIHATGCQVKDIEQGLVDWPAQRAGREILLCWKYGEADLGFWHDLDSGFAGRRPIAELATGATEATSAPPAGEPAVDLATPVPHATDDDDSRRIPLPRR